MEATEEIVSRGAGAAVEQRDIIIWLRCIENV